MIIVGTKIASCRLDENSITSVLGKRFDRTFVEETVPRARRNNDTLNDFPRAQYRIWTSRTTFSECPPITRSKGSVDNSIEFNDGKTRSARKNNHVISTYVRYDYLRFYYCAPHTHTHISMMTGLPTSSLITYFLSVFRSFVDPRHIRGTVNAIFRTIILRSSRIDRLSSARYNSSIQE